MGDIAHIYTAAKQPLTRYYDGNCGVSICFTHDEREVFTCHDCGRRRWAKNMTIQVYYDMSVIACREGHRWDGRRRRWVTLHKRPDGGDDA